MGTKYDKIINALNAIHFRGGSHFEEAGLAAVQVAQCMRYESSGEFVQLAIALKTAAIVAVKCYFCGSGDTTINGKQLADALWELCEVERQERLSCVDHFAAGVVKDILLEITIYGERF